MRCGPHGAQLQRPPVSLRLAEDSVRPAMKTEGVDLELHL